VTTTSPNKILIVKLHALGDLVIATPAIRHLRHRLPDTTIDLLTVKWTAPAVINSPHIDQIKIAADDIFFNRSFNTVLPTLRLLKEIRNEGYDAAVVFHRNPMIERFIRLCGVKQRYHFHSDLFVRGSNCSVLLDEQRHSAITAWELAELAVNQLTGRRSNGTRLQELKYEWFISDAEEETANTILNEYQLEDGKFAVIYPGGAVNPQDTSLVKRWSEDRFAELTDWLTNSANLPVVLLGADSDSDSCTAIRKKADRDVLNLSGKYDLRISAAITSKARIAVSNDSGPLHVASAVNTPVVGIFGPTGATHKLPPGNNSFEASCNLPCSPCYFTYFKGCIFDSIKCQELLTADMVIKVTEQTLESTLDQFQL